MPQQTSSGSFDIKGYENVTAISSPVYSQSQTITVAATGGLKSLAISGDGMYIACADGVFSTTSSLFVYKFNGTSYALYSTITVTTTYFGKNLSFNYDGTYLGIACDTKLYIYINNGTTYTQQTSFTIGTANNTDVPIDLSYYGDYLAICTSDSGSGNNGTRIYNRVGTSWSSQYFLANKGGYSVSLNDDGSICIFGGTSGGGTYGAVRRSGSSWSTFSIPIGITGATVYSYISGDSFFALSDKNMSIYNNATSTYGTAINNYVPANSPYVKAIMSKSGKWYMEFSVNGSGVRNGYSLNLYHTYSNNSGSYLFTTLPQSPSASVNYASINYQGNTIAIVSGSVIYIFNRTY
jgi:hypothetical protein